MGILKVLTNWLPEALEKVLRENNVVADSVNIRSSLGEFLNYCGGHDLCYFARFAPPLVDSSVALIKKVGKPVVYAFHSPLTIDHPIRPSHHIYNLLVPLQAVRVGSETIVHVLNATDLGLAETLGIRKVLFLPLGTDTNVFKPLDKEEEFTAIYASRASWHKGTDILVHQVIPILLKKIPGIKIRIVSYGFLTHLYKPFSSIKNVEVLSHMPLPEYARMLSRSHILLFPSRYESYGLVVLDALASGVIPVAFNVRGFVRDVLLKSSLVRDFVVEYPDVKGFIVRILRLYRLWLKSPEKYEFLPREARELATTYSWQNIGKLWANKFRLLAGVQE